MPAPSLTIAAHRPAIPAVICWTGLTVFTYRELLRKNMSPLPASARAVQPAIQPASCLTDRYLPAPQCTEWSATIAKAALATTSSYRSVTLGAAHWRAKPLRLLKIPAMPYSASAVAITTIAWNRVAPINSVTATQNKRRGVFIPAFVVSYNQSKKSCPERSEVRHLRILVRKYLNLIPIIPFVSRERKEAEDRLSFGLRRMSDDFIFFYAQGMTKHFPVILRSATRDVRISELQFGNI